MPEPKVTVIVPRAVLDVDTGQALEGACVRIVGNRIAAVSPDHLSAGAADEVIELPELTLIPGLMDMEVDLVLGGPGPASPILWCRTRSR